MNTAIKKGFIIIIVIAITVILFRIGHVGFFVPPILILTALFCPFVHKPSENVLAMAAFPFWLVPYGISFFIFSTLIYFIPNLTGNEYVDLAVLGLINFFCIIIMYFYLEWEFRKKFPTENKEIKSEFNDFLERVRISVDIIRFVVGIPLSLIILYARKVTKNEVEVFFNLISVDLNGLLIQPEQVVELLPFLVNSMLLPTILGASAIKIYADYAKYKTRPAFEELLNHPNE
ncbi:hypothetical protein Q0O85_00600 [Priestia megaterium]|uniref:hypothetical protein n=1 Tax=Priestia megaterium TaxID=1404 RepID=UPI00345827CF